MQSLMVSISLRSDHLKHVTAAAAAASADVGLYNRAEQWLSDCGRAFIAGVDCLTRWQHVLINCQPLKLWRHYVSDSDMHCNTRKLLLLKCHIMETSV